MVVSKRPQQTMEVGTVPALDVLTFGRKNADISPTPDGAGRGFRFGRFLLDHERGCLTRDGRDVGLRPKTFELLAFFAENAGRLLSKEKLLDAVWPDVFVTEDSLVRCVGELRQALDDGDHRMIRTVARRGYRFDPPQARASGRGGGLRRHRLLLVALLTLAVAIGATLAMQSRRAAPAYSIAVLPFETRGLEATYLGDGLASDLTADLARLPGLFVIAHATARNFDADSDLREVGDLLGVRYVLAGSIERNGKALRLTAELASAETGEVLWAERLSARRGRLAGARDELVGRIATTLNFRLTRIESERGRNERPDNPAASDLASRGWSLVYSGKKPGNYEAAREHFREAIQRDPHHANAMAGLGWTSAVMVMQGWSRVPSDDIAVAADAVDRALAILPDHVVALHVRGFLFRLQRRPDAAREAFRTVIALNPNFAPGHAQLAIAELELGHPEAVLPSVEKAMRLSPRDPSLGPWLAFAGMAELHNGNPAEAIEWLERAIDTGTPVALHRAYLASALALSGRTSEAAHAVSALLRDKSSLTIASLRAAARSSDPTFLMQQERLFDGLRLAGLPEV